MPGVSCSATERCQRRCGHNEGRVAPLDQIEVLNEFEVIPKRNPLRKLDAASQGEVDFVHRSDALFVKIVGSGSTSLPESFQHTTHKHKRLTHLLDSRGLMLATTAFTERGISS